MEKNLFKKVICCNNCYKQFNFCIFKTQLYNCNGFYLIKSSFLKIGNLIFTKIKLKK